METAPKFGSRFKGGAIVVLNEQHSLLPQQEALLTDRFGEWATWPLPAEGLDKAAVYKTAVDLVNSATRGRRSIVFASPVGALIVKTMQTAFAQAVWSEEGFDWADMVPVRVFFNDRREAVEQNGRIIHRLHPDGWKLV